MDEIVKKAFEFAEHMTVLSNQKNILREEFQQNLMYYEFGGTFTLTKEFLNFIHLLISNGQNNNVIVIDDNHDPICVEDLTTFFQNTLSKYTEASNEYYTKYSKLVSQRKIESLIDLDE